MLSNCNTFMESANTNTEKQFSSTTLENTFLKDPSELNVLLEAVQKISDNNLAEWTESLGRLMQAYYSVPRPIDQLQEDIKMTSELSAFFILINDCHELIEKSKVKADNLLVA